MQSAGLRWMLTGVLVCWGTMALGADVPVASPTETSADGLSAEIELQPPLPATREGGTPYDPNQPLTPYVIRAQRDQPGGLIESAPEYAPVRGVLYSYVPGQWTSVVVNLVAALTAPANRDEIAYVVVSSTAVQSAASSAFAAAGANLSKVQFILAPLDALWIRDYGPHFIWRDGALGISDSHYYPNRSRDNFIPTLVGDDYFLMPTDDLPLYFSGGNFMPGPNRTGFVTALINLDNPASEGFNADLIAELYQTYLGIDELHVMPQLPFSVDGTGHIDMWFYIVDPQNVIIAQFKPGSNATAVTITENAVPYMQNLGYTVHRVPAWHNTRAHYSYTNAFRVNDRIFIPTYGAGSSAYLADDAAALAVWQQAAGPGVEIVPINCWDIIPASGAIHCIVKQVPRYTGATPAVQVIYPRGGELLVAGETITIEWVATDTNNAPLAEIDLEYSADGGRSYEWIASPVDTGKFIWTVPDEPSADARIRVTAQSAGGAVGMATSAMPFEIVNAPQTRYDFAGTPTAIAAFGYQTSNWIPIQIQRRPVNTSVGLAIANGIAQSGDNVWYTSLSPSTGWESTHVFDFQINENPAELLKIDVTWRGYADACTQVELYVWDNVANTWGDGQGLLGQNRFFDNWAGNRDGLLTGTIRTDFERYVDANGVMTLLVYAERGSFSGTVVRTRHDYLSAVVTTQPPLPTYCPGDMNCDTLVTFADISLFIAAIKTADPADWPFDPVGGVCAYENGDFTGDGLVTFADLSGFIAAIKTNPEPCETMIP